MGVGGGGDRGGRGGRRLLVQLVAVAVTVDSATVNSGGAAGWPTMRPPLVLMGVGLLRRRLLVRETAGKVE